MSKPIVPPNFPPNWEEDANALNQAGEIRLGDILRQVWLGKWVFVVTIPIGIVIAVALMWVLPPKYAAEMIVSPSVNLAGRQGDSGASGGSGLLSLISSRTADEIASPFAQFQELLRSPEVAKRLDDKHSLLQIIYSDSWDTEKKTWKQPTGFLPSAKKTIKDLLNIPPAPPPNYQTLAEQLTKIVTITQKQRTSIWTVSVAYKDPVLAHDLLIWMHDEADAIVRQMATQRAQANVDYIVSTLPTVTVNEQRTALTALLLQQEFNMMMLHSNNSYSAEILEAPEIPMTRSSPNAALVLALCMLVAGGFGAIWAYFVGRRRRFESAGAPR